MNIPISGLEPADNGNGFHIRRADGQLVSKVDPVTRRATGEPETFRSVDGVTVTMGTPRILPASEMSASQRNQTFDATIQQLNAVIVQVNALTQAMHRHEADLKVLMPEMAQVIEAFERDAVERRSVWQRLRWLLTGR